MHLRLSVLHGCGQEIAQLCQPFCFSHCFVSFEKQKGQQSEMVEPSVRWISGRMAEM